MSAHPRYRGRVIDSHCHVDGEHLAVAEDDLERVGVGRWLNLWNTEWPPPGFAAWRAEVAGGGGAMGLGHAPDLSHVGEDGFARDLESSIREAAEQGAIAIKIWKNLGLTLRDAAGALLAVDDPRLDVVWGTAADTQLPVVIHVADPVAFFAPLDEENERLAELLAHPNWWFGGGQNPSFLGLMTQLDRLLGRHPETTFIGAHMGCYAEDLTHVGRMLGEHPNYFIDTSARVAEIGRKNPQAVRDFFLEYPTRILFGSDFSRTRNLMQPEACGGGVDVFFERYWSYFETDRAELEHPIPIQGDWRVHGIDLPDAVLDQLYRGNAERILPRLTAAVREDEAR